MMILSFVLLCAWVVVLAWNFKNAVIILPMFFPLYLLKFQVGFAPFNVVEVMVYLGFLWMIGREIYNRFLEVNNSFASRVKRIFCKDIKTNFFRFLMPVSALVFGSLAGLYVSYLYGDGLSALGIFKGWVLMPILYAVIVVRVLKNLDDKKKTLNFYILSSMVLSFFAIYQVLLKDYITIDQRASGPFESANYLALYVAPAFVLVLVNLWQRMEVFFFGEVERRGFARNLLIGVVGLFKKTPVVETVHFYVIYEIIAFSAIGLALVASRSYGAILGVFGALFLYTVYELFFSDFKVKYGSVLKKISVFVVIILMAVTAVFAQLGTAKFNDFLVFDRQSSSSVRVQTWTVTSKLIEESPFLGVGLGRFQTVYEQRASDILGVEPYEKTMLHPHNLMLSTWMNSGLIGVIAIMWIVFAVFWSFKNKKMSYDSKRFYVTVLAMFVVICLHGLVDQPFWKNDLAMIWWMIVGLVI